MNGFGLFAKPKPFEKVLIKREEAEAALRVQRLEYGNGGIDPEMIRLELIMEEPDK